MAFNGRFVVNMAQIAATQGADMDAILSLSGKGIEELCSDNCTVDSLVYNAILNKAVEETGDEFFGLHAGENLNLSAAGLIAQISHTSDTVKQALEYCCEFANLGCSSMPMSMEKVSSAYKVSLTPDPLWLSQSETAVKHTADGFLAFTIREFHSLTLQKHYPLEIHVTWARPDNENEYRRIFNCPVLYEQQELALILDEKHVEANVVTSDYELLRILVAHAQVKNQQLEGQRGFSSVVKSSIVKLVKPEFPSVEDVAGHLNLSVRSLQRKLSDEGVSFSNLIDELKKDFAEKYLQQPDLQISDVAYLLNYSEPSAFIRSFKRWTGKTPSEYRASASN